MPFPRGCQIAPRARVACTLGAIKGSLNIIIVHRRSIAIATPSASEWRSASWRGFSALRERAVGQPDCLNN